MNLGRDLCPKALEYLEIATAEFWTERPQNPCDKFPPKIDLKADREISFLVGIERESSLWGAFVKMGKVLNCLAIPFP